MDENVPLRLPTVSRSHIKTLNRVCPIEVPSDVGLRRRRILLTSSGPAGRLHAVLDERWQLEADGQGILGHFPVRGILVQQG